MSDLHELVLYKNRKFRSRKEKRYLTLDEIAESIQDGDTVQITRHDTGEDVTAEYLKGIFKYLDIGVAALHENIRLHPINSDIRGRRKAQVEKEKKELEEKKANKKAAKA